MDDRESGIELLQRWQNEREVWHFENSTDNLEKVVKAIGYSYNAFGSVIEQFLSDNPGAQAAIVEWIGEWIDRVPDWRENLEADVGPLPEDDEEE